MKSYKKPDLNAPRFRPKKHNILNKAFCDKIRSKHADLQHLTDEEIKTVIKTFNSNIWETAVENRDGVELLEQLGYIFIGSCPRKKWDNPNVAKSIQYGVKVQHQNWESDQYTAKIFYTNFETKYRFKFHQLWGFVGLRDFKRTVAATYPHEWKKYVVVDNMTKVSKLFRKHVVRDIMKKKNEILLEDYDEFDMT